MLLLIYYCLYSILKYELSLVLTSWPLLFADLPDQGQQLGRRLRLGLKRIQIRIVSMVANRTFKPQRCFTGNSHFLVLAHIPYLFSRCLRLFLLGQGEVLVVRRNEGGVTCFLLKLFAAFMSSTRTLVKYVLLKTVFIHELPKEVSLSIGGFSSRSSMNFFSGKNGRARVGRC